MGSLASSRRPGLWGVPAPEAGGRTPACGLFSLVFRRQSRSSAPASGGRDRSSRLRDGRDALVGKAVLLRREHVVRSPAPGRVTLLVGEGRHVRTGDIVMEIRDEAALASLELEEINRRLAQADLVYEGERSRLSRQREDLAMRVADARKAPSQALAQGEQELAVRGGEALRDFSEKELAQIDHALRGAGLPGRKRSAAIFFPGEGAPGFGARRRGLGPLACGRRRQLCAGRLGKRGGARSGSFGRG